MTYAWPTNFPPVCTKARVSALMRHPSFKDAKLGGDFEAAERLVYDLIDVQGLRELSYRNVGARIVVVGGGPADTNQIPRAYAEAVSRVMECPLDLGVLKANSPKHTGKSAMRRFLSRAEFAGRITRGATYIAVDDVMTQGGTVSELRQFLQAQGSRVVAVATLAFTDSSVMSDGIHIAPTADTRRKIASQFPADELKALFLSNGIYQGNPLALTESEARMVLRYKTIEELRGAIDIERSAMAAEQIDRLPDPASRSAGRSR